MFLNLKYDGENYRAYMDSSASNRIDFSKIEIPTKEKIKENIYFSFNGMMKYEAIDQNKIEIIYKE